MIYAIVIIGFAISAFIGWIIADYRHYKSLRRQGLVEEPWSPGHVRFRQHPEYKKDDQEKQ